MRLLGSIKKLARSIFVPTTPFEVPLCESKEKLALRTKQASEKTHELAEALRQTEKPDEKGEPEVESYKSEKKEISLVLARIAVEDYRVHYIDEDEVFDVPTWASKDGHRAGCGRTLCDSKVFTTDKRLPLIVEGRVREITCSECRKIVVAKSELGIVKIARVKPKKDSKRGKPIKEKPPLDDGIISINRHDDYHPRTPDVQQELPFSVRPHTTPVLAVSALFTTLSHNFGTVLKGDTPVYEFKITNPFNEEVRISSVSTSSGHMEVWLHGCGSATGPHNRHKFNCSHAIAPHSETKLYVRVMSGECDGREDSTITVEFERPARRHLDLYIYSYITKRLTQNPGPRQFRYTG